MPLMSGSEFLWGKLCLCGHWAAYHDDRTGPCEDEQCNREYYTCKSFRPDPNPANVPIGQYDKAGGFRLGPIYTFNELVEGTKKWKQEHGDD